MNTQTRMKRCLILFFIYAGGIESYSLSKSPKSKSSESHIDEAIGFPKVNIHLKDADLVAATQALTKQTGIQFLIVPSEQPFQKINLSLKRLPADLAIQYLCKAAGGWSEQDASGVFIIRAGNPPEKVAATLDMIVDRIKVHNKEAKDIYGQLMESKQGINPKSDPPTEKRSTKPEVTVEPEVYFPNPGLVPEGAAQQYTPGPSTAFTPYGGGGMSAGGSASSLSAGQGLVPQNIEYLTYDPTDNSLVVKGTEEAIRKLQQTVTTLDKAPKQILITVEFITTSRTNNREVGMDAGFHRGGKEKGSSIGTGRFVGNGGFGPLPAKDKDGNAVSPATGFTTLTNPLGLFIEYGKFAMDIRANALTGNGKVINLPILRTLNNQPAVVERKDDITIILTDQQQNQGVGPRDVQKTENISASTRLIVTPRYNEGDDTITAYIQPQIENFEPPQSTAGVKEVTRKTSQSTKLVTRSKNGETIMIAGLTKRDRTREFERVPILGNILPGLFGKTKDTYTDNDLRIFITMSVIPDDPSQLLYPPGA